MAWPIQYIVYTQRTIFEVGLPQAIHLFVRGP